MSVRFKMYKKLHNGKFKYIESFNSTLDPNYHQAINDFKESKTEWELRNYAGVTVHKNQSYD